MRDSRDVEVRVEGCRVLGVVVGDFSRGVGGMDGIVSSMSFNHSFRQTLYLSI